MVKGEGGEMFEMVFVSWIDGLQILFEVFVGDEV